MTTPDDYAALALRLGDAAGVLEEVSMLYGYQGAADTPWTAGELRREAEKLTETEPITLTDMFAMRDAGWSQVPACATHYPHCCECKDDKL